MGQHCCPCQNHNYQRLTNQSITRGSSPSSEQLLMLRTRVTCNRNNQLKYYTSIFSLPPSPSLSLPPSLPPSLPSLSHSLPPSCPLSYLHHVPCGPCRFVWSIIRRWSCPLPRAASRCWPSSRRILCGWIRRRHLGLGVCIWIEGGGGV